MSKENIWRFLKHKGFSTSVTHESKSCVVHEEQFTTEVLCGEIKWLLFLRINAIIWF